jgi:3-methyladenine DNA glycosylase AlkD
MLLTHPHDLIQKAVGWMLREAGKQDYEAERKFLVERYKKMPRTMLSYAIEKFDEEVRMTFLKGGNLKWKILI